MYPDLFTIGKFTISSFGLMMVLAFVASYFQLRAGMRYLGIGDEEDVSAIVFTAGVAGIVGSKAYFAILKGDWRFLFDRSGLVWYGGFFLAAIALAWLIRHRGLPLAPTLDTGAAALPLGYAVGRVGCFLVGDDYGVPTDLPWGVAFPEGSPNTYAYSLRAFGVDLPPEIPGDTLIAVHPTQLYETGMALIIWWIARSYLKQRPAAGRVAALVIILLAVERFIVEFFRAKDDRFFGALTLAQVLSIALLVLGLVAFGMLRERREAAA